MRGRPDVPARRSAIGTVLRHVARRFRQGHAALPDASWRAWLRFIGTGIVAMFALMLLLRFAAERALDGSLHARERAILLWLGRESPLSFSTAVFLQTFGSDITLLVLVTLTAGIAAWARRPISALSIPLAFLVPDVVGRFGWSIWARARPDLLFQGIPSPGFHSFPSGHASKTIAIYGLLTVLWIRASRTDAEKLLAGTVLAAIVSAVAVGRTAMGVHWPSDIIGGLIVGGTWLLLLAYGLRWERDLAGERIHTGDRSPP